MVKVLFVSTISDTVNAFLIPHIKLLVQQGNEVGIACNNSNEISPELIEIGCKTHLVEFQRVPLRKENIKAYKQIGKVVANENYEVVHVHTPIASFLTRLACRHMKDIKMLYTAHGFHFFKGAPKINWAIYAPLEKIAARWTDCVITMNLEDYYSAMKLKVRNSDSLYRVHGVGINLQRFAPQSEEQKNHIRKAYNYKVDDFIIIYVGELSYRKHQDLLINSIRLVGKKFSNIKLLLVGDGGYKDKYESLVTELGVEEKVEFLGYRKDIHNLMMLSDVSVSSSRQEGLPVNVMEAMATGLPLIVTNCRGNRDLVRSGENGIIVDVDDVEAFARAIEKLYSSKELRERFSIKNKELIQLYSLPNVMKEMKDIYDKELFHTVDKKKITSNSSKLV